ncbi:hypothetical protein [Deinococcus ficus]|uniref:hypothetical protein n=1 Tax=Deinococcus ficus TaxID=317577 RepID=UPI00174DD850|nr:hypothetical protein [Deinococcus ficus]GHF66941.1 hypothetical protein GCM10017782_00590 [Deinococcus ficus]
MTRRGPGCGCLGCGGSLLIIAALLGAAWLFVLKPAQDFLNGMRIGPAQSQSQTDPTPGGSGVNVPQLPGGSSTPASTPGSVNAPVTKADVQAFVRVRRQAAQALGGSFTELQNVWTQIQNGQTPNLLQVFTVLRNTTGSVNQARAAQGAQLDKENMSAERYAVVRATVNRALGLPNIDFAQAAEAVQQGRMPDLNRTVVAATPEERALVEPFRAELQQTAAAGLLGL